MCVEGGKHHLQRQCIVAGQHAVNFHGDILTAVNHLLCANVVPQSRANVKRFAHDLMCNALHHVLINHKWHLEIGGEFLNLFVGAIAVFIHTIGEFQCHYCPIVEHTASGITIICEASASQMDLVGRVFVGVLKYQRNAVVGHIKLLALLPRSHRIKLDFQRRLHRCGGVVVLHLLHIFISHLIGGFDACAATSEPQQRHSYQYFNICFVHYFDYFLMRA